jgi:proteasome accessory factor C
MSTTDQVTRLLSLVPYLQSRGGYAGLREVAELYGVPVKQLRKDVELLQFVGDQERGPENLIDIDLEGLDEGDIFLSNADFLTRPMRFTPDEGVSLAVALHAIAELAGPEQAAAARSALEKLREAGRAPGAIPIAVDTHTGTPEMRDALSAAIAERRVVRLTYDGRQGATTVTPVVEPKWLVTQSRHSYLQAWNRELDAWRVYRLDRIAQVEPLEGEEAVERGEPEPFDEGWLERRPDAAVVTVELDERGSWVKDYWPVRAVRPTAVGIAVELLVADQAWLDSQLLKLGPSVLAVTPPAAARPAAQEAAEALAGYGH